MVSYRDTSRDWDVLVAQMKEALGDRFPKWKTGTIPGRFNGANMMTPNRICLLNVDGLCVEIAQGYGLVGEPLFGVTFPDWEDERSQVFTAPAEVVAHLDDVLVKMQQVRQAQAEQGMGVEPGGSDRAPEGLDRRSESMAGVVDTVKANPHMVAFLLKKEREFGDKFDPSDLYAAAQFIPHFGTTHRIKVDLFGEVHHGTVSVTSGYRPSFLLMHNVKAIGSSNLLREGDRLLAWKPRGDHAWRWTA